MMTSKAALQPLLLLLAVLMLPSATRAVRVVPSDVPPRTSNTTKTSTAATLRQRRKLSSNVEVPFPSSPDDHLVTSLPLLKNGTLPTKHWAGLLPASKEGDKYFFYWLFAPDHDTPAQTADEDIPLIIWLNGGPGCSSMDGLFLENGPLEFVLNSTDNTYEIVARQHSWHKLPAYVLYIDQPVGTGLSFTTSRKYPKNDEEVNIDFYYFLQSFLKAHSDKFVVSDDDKKKTMSRPLYFSGESHAGHYVPSMMTYILKQQNSTNEEEEEDEKIEINLAGAAIANGWVDPIHQYAAAEAAYGHGIIDRAQKAAFNEKEAECQTKLRQGKYVNSVCFDLLDDIVRQSYGSQSGYKVSSYDVRKQESRRGDRTFPPGHKVVETYLGGTGTAAGMSLDTTTQAALEALHAAPSRQAGQVYAECTDPPYNALSHQDGLGVVPDVVTLLESPANIRLLFFNGVLDLICNHVGNEIMLEKLPWKHQQEWIQAERTAWKATSSSEAVSGYMKEYDNLLFLKLLNAGHMVPMDIPDVALEMMQLFVYGGKDAFSHSPQQLQCSAHGGQCPCTDNNRNDNNEDDNK